jgi:hypothetical protein
MVGRILPSVFGAGVTTKRGGREEEVGCLEVRKMVSGNGEFFHLARDGRAGGGGQGVRPPRRPKKSISSRREDSDMWAESVEKPKEPKPLLAVEPLLVSEETASDVLGISPRSVWELGDKGVLQTKRIGRRKLYLFNSLKAFAESGMEVE